MGTKAYLAHPSTIFIDLYCNDDLFEALVNERILSKRLVEPLEQRHGASK